MSTSASSASSTSSSSSSSVSALDPDQFMLDDSVNNVRLGSRFTLPRTNQCDYLLHTLQAKGAVLVRSSPGTGKTSMITVLRDFASKQKLPADPSKLLYTQIYTISAVEWEPSEETFVAFFQRLTESSRDFYQILAEAKDPTLTDDRLELMVIDEGQVLYGLGPTHKFWKQVKGFVNRQEKRRLHLAMFAAYGDYSGDSASVASLFSPFSSSTSSSSSSIVLPSAMDFRGGSPVQFPCVLGIDFLSFTAEEFNQLRLLSNDTSVGKCVNLSDEMAEYIYRMTKGHPGLSRLVLANISRTFMSATKTKRAVSEQEVFNYLSSQSFLSVVAGHRSVPPASLFLADARPLLIRLITSSDDVIHIGGDDSIDAAIADRLIKQGFVVRTDQGDGITFPSPLIRAIFIERIYSFSSELRSCLPSTYSGWHSFDDFIKLTLSLFDANVLAATLSVGSTGLTYERQFQMEFYRCARTVCYNEGKYSHPDVGKYFGSSGYLDFYVNGDLQWAVELVRNSSNLDEHVQRFKDGGNYSKFSKEKALLNFIEVQDEEEDKEMRTDTGKLQVFPDWVWHIVWRRQSKVVWIRRGGRKEEEIKISVMETWSETHKRARAE